MSLVKNRKALGLKYPTVSEERRFHLVVERQVDTTYRVSAPTSARNLNFEVTRFGVIMSPKAGEPH